MLLLFLIRKCFYNKRRSQWIGVSFWEKIIPYAITLSLLKKYANKLDRELLVLIKFNAFNTQEKIDTLYRSSDKRHKAFLLSQLQAFEKRLYPSLELIDKDIKDLRHSCSLKFYQEPDERLANSFTW